MTHERSIASASVENQPHVSISLLASSRIRLCRRVQGCTSRNLCIFRLFTKFGMSLHFPEEMPAIVVNVTRTSTPEKLEAWVKNTLSVEHRSLAAMRKKGFRAGFRVSSLSLLIFSLWALVPSTVKWVGNFTYFTACLWGINGLMPVMQQAFSVSGVHVTAVVFIVLLLLSSDLWVPYSSCKSLLPLPLQVIITLAFGPWAQGQ